MNHREETINIYRDNAAALAEKFDGIGSRRADIERAFSYMPKSNPVVVEIGCGNGRDAKDILTHTNNYVGVDISEGMIELARAANPQGNFEIADFAMYAFPKETDIVFAFAALLHSDRDEVRTVLSRVHAALSPEGIVYISLKYGLYQHFIKHDTFGDRIFFLYTPEDVRDLAGEGYRAIYTDRQTIGHTEWFTIALQKVSL